METTFVMIKPDGVQRGFIGEIISRIEKKGFCIIDMYMTRMHKEEAQLLYECHKDKDFYDELIKFTISSPVVIMAVSGLDAVKMIRILVGATDLPGTIRGDFSLTQSNRNLIHASDSKANAKKELEMFFASNFLEECMKHELTNYSWIYSKKDLKNAEENT